MTVVLLLGNGLSTGFDPRLARVELHERVVQRLGPDFTQVLEELAELSQKESIDTPIAVETGSFERLAGPLDRLAEALNAVEGLLQETADAKVLEGLRTASEELRRQYFRIVGVVLAEVDRCCVAEGELDEQRREAWDRLYNFASALIEWDGGARRVTTFTLNYDSLLMSSMLENTKFVYDGFRGGTLNVPLDRWSEPALYHLHGSVGWVRTANELISKRRLQDMREQGVIEAWANGRVDHGLPSVMLGDMKSRAVGRYPFSLMYEEFRRCLAEADMAVVGGYGFGDRPVNLALAEYLAKTQGHRLLVWNPAAEAEQVLDRIRAQLPEGEGMVHDAQVSVESVTLPDTAAVARAQRQANT